MRRRLPRPGPDRRGVTLVEMLVTVALVVLIMTIIVNVFRSATGAVHGMQVSHDMDSSLRRIEALIRQDLTGATARFTPPLDPKDNLGYFEYGENVRADDQGEDTDDYMALTVKAPEGQPFTGRCWVASSAFNPVTITSEYAEVLYFLRNGNLYRRVLLIVPDRRGLLSPPTVAAAGATPAYSTPTSFLAGLPVSWQGVNDVSARPSTSGSTTPVPNTLGDLTNRQNRIFRPRFTDDYVTVGGGAGPDGVSDDLKGGQDDAGNPMPNGVPDFYPTLYPNVFATGLVNEVAFARLPAATLDNMPFPFVYPGPYSVAASPVATSNLGPIHGLSPINHSPVDLGDPLLTALGTPTNQTYWGWPTWKETLSPNWSDPTWQLASNSSGAGIQSPGLTWAGTTTLPPPMTTAAFGAGAPYRVTAQPFNDGLGGTGASGLASTVSPPAASLDAVWQLAWEDDLILTGVRSFDIKAFDNNASVGNFALPAGYPGLVSAYYDLGGGKVGNFDYSGTYAAGVTPNASPAAADYTTYTPILQTFQHEGRIPPKVQDLRLDPQISSSLYRNVGDDATGAVRLRRVWDSWSTDYTSAPAFPLNPANGPLNNQYPVYPSYPPPYPAPLRGIQIQIRVVNDPVSDHVKSLTIRQDFTDKL